MRLRKTGMAASIGLIMFGGRPPKTVLESLQGISSNVIDTLTPAL